MNSHVHTIPRDGTVLILIHLFGLSYFLFLMAAFLIRHLPRSSDDIYDAQAVIFYIIGVMQWCLCSLLYRAVWILDQEQAASWTKIERASTLFLIYVVATPFLLSTREHYGHFRFAYLFFLTIMTTGRITTVVSLHSYNGDHFVQDCLFLGSLAIAPSIYVLCQPGQPAPPLAAGLIRLVGCNLLGFLCYLVQLPERLSLVGHWEPSLYAMHLAMILGCISYAPAVLGIAA